MKTVNRSSLIVRPKRPFVEWANRIDDGPEYPEYGEPTLYLVPEFNDDQEMEEWLRQGYENIFEHELWSWTTDASTWPQQREFTLFQAWFEVQSGSIVVEPCDDRLQRDAG